MKSQKLFLFRSSKRGKLYILLHWRIAALVNLLGRPKQWPYRYQVQNLLRVNMQALEFNLPELYIYIYGIQYIDSSTRRPYIYQSLTLIYSKDFLFAWKTFGEVLEWENKKKKKKYDDDDICEWISCWLSRLSLPLVLGYKYLSNPSVVSIIDIDDLSADPDRMNAKWSCGIIFINYNSDLNKREKRDKERWK